MANQFTFLLGALIIGASLVVPQFVNRYAISSVLDTTGAPIGAWRLNVRTGDIEVCSFTENPFAKITGKYDLECRKSVHDSKP
jgi:hypothetical protein